MLKDKITMLMGRIVTRIRLKFSSIPGLEYNVYIQLYDVCMFCFFFSFSTTHIKIPF